MSTTPTPTPTVGSDDFWEKFGQTAATVALTIGEQAALIFSQAFVTALANKISDKK